MRCIVCNRPLKSEKSQSRLMGNVCLKRHGKIKYSKVQFNLFYSKNTYTVDCIPCEGILIRQYENQTK